MGVGITPVKARAVLIGPLAAVNAAASVLDHVSDERFELAGFFAPDANGVQDVVGVPLLGAALSRDALNAAGDVRVLIRCGGVEDRRQARAFLEQASAFRLHPMVAERVGDGLRVRRMHMADILGRAPSPVDWANIRGALAGKRILVTGAGGSIGSEICRQIVQIGPERLTLLDSSEYNLFSIDHELAKIAPGINCTTALCDIRNQDTLARWFARERPEIVFHVAALKQVPLLEDHASEGVLTNVMGTRNVARAARAAGAHMVLVSTDKAVSPRSTMGATKRMAELYCQALDMQAGARNGPRFLVARLGNVLGSAGSVTPLFERQLAKGGPLTVTHPNVVRYFITIPQAASFLLQAAAGGIGSQEPRGVANVLEMGEPLPVLDLARDMIRLAGRQPDVDVDIQIIGLRPGEKMAEQLVGEDEWIVGEEGGHVIAVKSEPRNLDEVDADMDALIELAHAGRDEMVKTRLMANVGQPIEEDRAAAG